MDIRVNHRVMMSALQNINADTIGTEGVGPCVGLVVLYNNRTRVLCAHFSSSIQGRNKEQQAEIVGKTKDILQQNIDQEVRSIELARMVSENRDPSSISIVNGIREFFREKHLGDVPLSNVNGIALLRDGDGDYFIREIYMNDHLVHGEKCENNIADIEQNRISPESQNAA
ncbi:MAG: hypothetical protein OEZ43_05935 [Gammaproteobacteria bacterium]|nr:hypothetical protein [Gammaproteobacteria bacterium]